MSELKVIKIELNNHGKPIASIQGTTSYYGISPNDTFYLKSEADKVIADKDAKILALDAEVFKQKHHAKLFFDERNYAETQLRHHKYKRCLDKAEMCKARYDEEDAKVNGCGASWEYISKEMKYWERWYKRWLELAEKFKEAK